MYKHIMTECTDVHLGGGGRGAAEVKKGTN